MTVFEEFVSEEVMKGRSILGLYPPTEEKTRDASRPGARRTER